MNWWQQLCLNTGLAALKQAIKNPLNREKLKRVCLDIYLAIKAAFAEDPDFN